MYKHQTNLLPQTFSNYFIKHNQIHKYPTRNTEDHIIHNAKNKMFSDRSIQMTGPTLWNSLDSKMKHCKTIKHFRNELKSSLIANMIEKFVIFGACLLCRPLICFVLVGFVL